MPTHYADPSGKKKKTRVSECIRAKVIMPGGLDDTKLFNSSDFIGLELELENSKSSKLFDFIGEYFEAVQDGSLKYDGIELRFKSALNGSNIINSLNVLDAGIAKFKLAPYTEGNRGSTHIHLNVSNLSVQQLFNIVLMSYFVEPILMDMCHVDRLFSPFSVTSNRTKDQKYILSTIAEGHMNFESSGYKYRSIGLSSVFNKGSLEYRMFHASYDTKEILQWINFVQEIKHIAITTQNLQEKICSSLEVGLAPVLYDLFGRPTHCSERARREIWDFVREYSFNPVEEVRMDSAISSFFKKANA